MMQISPYLHFNGKCSEAMKFYKECLGGELVMQKVGESPMAEQMPGEMQDQILHASLDRGKLSLMGSDMVGPDGIVEGNAISLTLICDSQEEIKDCFSRLADGGSVVYPLSEQFWGAIYGELTDRYGINWMLNFEKNKITKI
jgi:PhnB protein